MITINEAVFDKEVVGIYHVTSLSIIGGKLLLHISVEFVQKSDAEEVFNTTPQNQMLTVKIVQGEYGIAFGKSKMIRLYKSEITFQLDVNEYCGGNITVFNDILAKQRKE